MSNVVVKELVVPQVVAASMYTAPAGATASIQAATFFNGTAGTVVVQAGICSSGVALAAGVNMLVNETVLAGKTYVCYELINQKIPPGYELRCAGVGCIFAAGGIEVSGQ